LKNARIWAFYKKLFPEPVPEDTYR
jgi:hypothetical protein